MAQALFDEHPLEQYLLNAGETRDLCPGSTAELEYELDPFRGTELKEDENIDVVESHSTTIVANILETIATALSNIHPSNHPSPFVERFKYHVISSSLLAVALPSTHGRTPRSSIPGQLDHSRSPSPRHTPPPTPTTFPDSSFLIPSLSLLMAALFLHAGHILLALASLGITVYTLISVNETSKHDMTSSLASLNELVEASDTWESVVQEAVNFLEHDDHSISLGSSTSSIRATLHSTLLTTQTQCDNVRQLFSALTSPSELSQLSEMYAPPSPVAQSFSHDRNTRPLSLPVRRRTLSMPSDPFLVVDSKRQTWSGPRQPGSLNNSFLKRREKRRSDLSSLLQSYDKPLLKTVSAPVTPVPDPLPFAMEEIGSNDLMPYPHSSDATVDFGAAALALRREQKSAGMNIFKLPSSSHFDSTSSSPTPQTPKSPPMTTLPPGTRYTPIQATRHPLSLSALNYALQAALASKRYASSHLLALRFADEEDEGYWEDVRSVIGLLTSALLDASSRLSEALTEMEQQKLRDQNPTPCLGLMSSENSDRSLDDSDASPSSSPLSKMSRRPMSISFAPLPSNVSRFTTHVESIISALDDAKVNLEECVTSLREELDAHPSAPDSKRRRRRRNVSTEEPVSSPALEAYERMRRELGMALRECERGRERLLDAVFPPDLYAMEEEDSGEDLPALGHYGSDDSDKPDQLIPSDDDDEEVGQVPSSGSGYGVVAVEGAETSMDDASAHLLLVTSTQHLPPPGIEQVFEADSGNVGAFSRERSKLTREERIKLMKARRESGNGGVVGLQSDDLTSSVTKKTTHSAGIEKWGPGGEVVQELKDVIWKVGERRRRMGEALDCAGKILAV